MNLRKYPLVNNPTGHRALLDATLIALFILSVFYYWFALANRSIIFLYDHVAEGLPRAEPFDAMTSSRYWMAGLVATGAVMVVYTGIYWLLGQLRVWRRYAAGPPLWHQVWILCALPLTIGIPLITLTVNRPTLPPTLAVACVGSTLVGLALALWPAAWAARRPLDLLWLGGDGIGLMPILLVLRVVELPSQGLSIREPVAALVAIGSIVIGAGWLVVMTGLRLWRHKSLPGASALLASGLGSSYLLLPLLHYLLGRVEYRYITTASNFFAFHFSLQLFIFIVAGGLALGVTMLRRRLSPWSRRDSHQQARSLD